ncbi:MAG: histidinol-phosphate transaminase [Xanthomonadales bacterium]|nr:histidinol-phosphate transaminase [Xanthomonadales bacterium]
MNSDCDLTQLAAPGVRDLRPYQPGKPISELEREYGVENIIKLASNENPLGASPLALRAMQSELASLALYPDGAGFELKQALAARHRVSPERITLGNGSNDVLVLLAEAFLTPDTEAVYSQYCFAVYPIAVQAAGAVARAVPALDMGHDLDAMQAAISTRTRLVFIANPNNPTGTWLDGDALHGFLETVPSEVIVVVDEAYHEYALREGAPDATAWLDEFPNLVVTRTFSKAYGLAGIRFGYSLSSARVADILNRIRQPFNVNSLALAGALAALDDVAFIQRSVRANGTERERVAAGLGEIGIPTLPSAANFVLADMGGPAAPVYEFLLRDGIIVRPVGNYGLPNHLRITIGTADQNQSLLRSLAAWQER